MDWGGFCMVMDDGFILLSTTEGPWVSCVRANSYYALSVSRVGCILENLV